MEKKILTLIFYSLLLPWPILLMPNPLIRRVPSKLRNPPAEVPTETTAQSASDYAARTAADALAQATAIRNEVGILADRVEATAQRAQTAATTAQNAAAQAAASQAHTQNLSAVIIAIGAYGIYTKMKKNKKQDTITKYYRKLYQQWTKQIRTLKISRKEIETFCKNCLPNSIYVRAIA